VGPQDVGKVHIGRVEGDGQEGGRGRSVIGKISESKWWKKKFEPWGRRNGFEEKCDRYLLNEV